MRIAAFAAVLLAFTFARGASAAEFSEQRPGVVWLTGEIQQGDYSKIARFLIANDKNRRSFLLGALFLDSPGGNVAEAMKIAELVNYSFVATVVEKGRLCASSCFIIFAGGVSRKMAGTLGVHRLSLAKGSTDIRATESAIQPTARNVNSFLLAMGMPRRVLEKMEETSPLDLYRIDMRWLVEQELFATMLSSPSFADAAEKACGIDPLKASVTSRESNERWFDCTEDVRAHNQAAHIREINAAINRASKAP